MAENFDCRPIQVLKLDLRDTRLRELVRPGLREIPLFIDPIGPDEWTYQIDSKKRVLLKTRCSKHPLAKGHGSLPLLETQRISLRETETTDQPINEDTYWTLCDRFAGGHDFIRVLGSPIWLQRVEERLCDCGGAMNYIASIGYGGEGSMTGMRFLVGEFASYFFLCEKCPTIKVVAQSV